MIKRDGKGEAQYSAIFSFYSYYEFYQRNMAIAAEWLFSVPLRFCEVQATGVRLFFRQRTNGVRRTAESEGSVCATGFNGVKPLDGSLRDACGYD